MNEDITNFESGIDVDAASDIMAENPDPEFMRDFFGRIGNANFLVPYRDKVNTIPLLDIKDKGKMIPIFSSFFAFEKSPLPKDKANIMPFSKIDEIVRKSDGKIAGIIINP
ncbi:MAG: SseB family protein, partial [Oscillospiraceae bacterium]|nr:SseB family protein [Oscillospiraceae bacterium]